MNTSSTENGPVAEDIDFKGDYLIVTLSDGHFVSSHLSCFPRLLNASTAQRQKWNLTANGQGIHWPDIDEDISVRRLLS